MRISSGSFDIPDAEGAYLKVVLKLQGTSLRKFVTQAVIDKLTSMRPTYRDCIAFKAQKLGLTWEECFNLYTTYEPPFTRAMIESMKGSQPTITRTYGQDAK